MPDERPRRFEPSAQRCLSPVSTVIWAAIEKLDEGEKHQLLAGLRDHLATPDKRESSYDGRVARAIAAVREAQTIHQAISGADVLSSYAYTKLQEEREHDWPPVCTVCAAILVSAGGPTYFARCQLPTAADDDRVEQNWNHAFSHAEASAAAAECANELHRLPSWWEYLYWSRRTHVKRRPGRRPRSQSAFDRL